MVEIPKREGWASAIWEKFPNNPVFFFEGFPYDYDYGQSLSPGVDCQGALEAARRFTDLFFGHLSWTLYLVGPTSYYSSGSQMTKSFTLDTGSSLS